jgi:hypothetical protein
MTSQTIETIVFMTEARYPKKDAPADSAKWGGICHGHKDLYVAIACHENRKLIDAGTKPHANGAEVLVAYQAAELRRMGHAFEYRLVKQSIVTTIVSEVLEGEGSLEINIQEGKTP